MDFVIGVFICLFAIIFMDFLSGARDDGSRRAKRDEKYSYKKMKKDREGDHE